MTFPIIRAQSRPVFIGDDKMEFISSRKNKAILHLKKLSSDSAYRRECGEYICDGAKLLDEALNCGAEITSILWASEPGAVLQEMPQYSAPADLLEYVSPLKNSHGPIFTVKIPKVPLKTEFNRVILLENIQDPGNVGTVIRTANAFNMDAVLLMGDCADIYNPKVVRSTMGAIFRQTVFSVDRDMLLDILSMNRMKLYGAALTESALGIDQIELRQCAIAIGNEGRGLSQKLLDMCDGELIIPMETNSESLNAAVAASIVMWEIYKSRPL